MSDSPRTDAAEHNMGSVVAPHYVVDSEVVKEIERELAKATALASRSTQRLAELAEPGSIGAFAARDHWKDRAEHLETEVRRLQERLEHAEKHTEHRG